MRFVGLFLLGITRFAFASGLIPVDEAKSEIHSENAAVPDWLLQACDEIDVAQLGKKRRSESYTEDHLDIVRKFVKPCKMSFKEMHAAAIAEMTSRGLSGMKYHTFARRLIEMRDEAGGRDPKAKKTDRKVVELTPEHESIIRKYIDTVSSSLSCIYESASAEMASKDLEIMPEGTFKKALIGLRKGKALQPRKLFRKDHESIMRSHLSTGLTAAKAWPKVELEIRTRNLPPLRPGQYKPKANAIRKELGLDQRVDSSRENDP